MYVSRYATPSYSAYSGTRYVSPVYASERLYSPVHYRDYSQPAVTPVTTMHKSIERVPVTEKKTREVLGPAKTVKVNVEVKTPKTKKVTEQH